MESCNTPKRSSTGQQPPLMHRNTNSQGCFVDTRGDSVFLEGSAPKRKADVRLDALSIYTRAAGGVRVTKHAQQLSLACFVNTQR